MAVLQPGVLIADRIPALIRQVVELCNEYPPVRAPDISHACFPGYMINTPPDMGAWKIRFEELCREIDVRMIVLHNANMIWRREIKARGESYGKPVYGRYNEARRVEGISEELADIPFHEIVPLEDSRFPFIR